MTSKTKAPRTVVQIHEADQIHVVAEVGVKGDGQYLYNEALTPEAFKAIQEAAGPCTKVYEACNDLAEYLDHWWRAEHKPCVGECIRDIIGRERLHQGNGDWYNADGESATEEVKAFFLGVCQRLLRLLRRINWRVTNASQYTAYQCLGMLDPRSRQGLYVQARTPEEALTNALRPDSLYRFGGTAESWEVCSQRAFTAWFVGHKMYKAIHDSDLHEALEAKFTA